MSLRLCVHGLLGGNLKIGGKRAKILRLHPHTSSASLLNADPSNPGFRVANEDELRAFLKKYKPRKWFPSILAFAGEGDEQASAPGWGTIVRMVSTTPDGEIKQASQNLVWGLPSNSLVLHIHD